MAGGLIDKEAREEALKLIAEIGGNCSEITGLVSTADPIYDLANEAESMVDRLEVLVLGYDPMDEEHFGKTDEPAAHG